MMEISRLTCAPMFCLWMMDLSSTCKSQPAAGNISYSSSTLRKKIVLCQSTRDVAKSDIPTMPHTRYVRRGLWAQDVESSSLCTTQQERMQGQKHSRQQSDASSGGQTRLTYAPTAREGPSAALAPTPATHWHQWLLARLDRNLQKTHSKHSKTISSSSRLVLTLMAIFSPVSVFTASLTLPNVPSPMVLPTWYFPT